MILLIKHIKIVILCCLKKTSKEITSGFRKLSLQESAYYVPLSYSSCNYDTKKKIKKWIENNLTSDWAITYSGSTYRYWFVEKKDAVSFKLKWY
jgi:hypothetical protein